VKAASFQIRLCENPECGLRYPAVELHLIGDRCPACLGTTRLVLTRTLENEPQMPSNNPDRSPFVALLDNIRSAWNVGSIFRTSEGYGLQHIHLCGITPRPGNTDLGKTALGAENNIPWTYHKNSVPAAERLKRDSHQLWALESDPRAIPISEVELPQGLSSQLSGIALIVGNEETGVDPGLLDICNKIIYLPMRGEKRSFNVAVAFGIAIQFLGFLFQKNNSH